MVVLHLNGYIHPVCHLLICSLTTFSRTIWYSNLHLKIFFKVSSNIADVLLNGRVEYSVKMLGFAEVSEPKGTHVIRDAIHAIRFQLQVIVFL